MKNAHISWHAMLAKNHRSHLEICRGLQGFRFQERATCRSNDLCRRLSKWLICPSVWSLGRSIFHQYSFITQCSLKPAWCDGRNMRWQMMSSDAPYNWESQEIKSAGVWGCGVLRGHKLRFLWAKITELEQTGTSDQHNIRSHTDNKFKNLKFTHPCQGSLISCAR